MATPVGRIAEQGLKLLNEIAAEARSLESFASSGLDPASGGGTLLFVSLAVEAGFPASAAGAALTPREREVLQWAGAGKTNAEIAAILDMSPRTVEKHFEHVFEKLGVETRVAAVMRLLAGSPQR